MTFDYKHINKYFSALEIYTYLAIGIPCNLIDINRCFRATC
jgi:hypothetical protein